MEDGLQQAKVLGSIDDVLSCEWGEGNRYVCQIIFIPAAENKQCRWREARAAWPLGLVFGEERFIREEIQT